MADSDRNRRIEKRLERDGFILKRQEGHRIWWNPDGRQVVISSSPGGGRSHKNMLAELKRLKVPPLKKRHERKEYPLLQTEKIGPVPEPDRVLQVSVTEILVAQEMLKGNDVPEYPIRHRQAAVGKILMRWLNQNEELRYLAERFADRIQPDYEFEPVKPAQEIIQEAMDKVFGGSVNDHRPERARGNKQALGRSTRLSPAAPIRRVGRPPKPSPEQLKARYTKHGYMPVGYNKCSVCKRTGHNARSCPERKASA